MRSELVVAFFACALALGIFLGTGDIASFEARAASWRTGTVDVCGPWAGTVSAAVDGGGNPRLVCAGPLLRYARWTGSEWDVQTVVGEAPQASIALDRDGDPHIAFYSASGLTLKYAAWTGSEWSITGVDGRARVGSFPSIAFGPAGSRHISYYDEGNGHLRHAWWTGVGWRAETVDNASNVGMSTSTAVDANGDPHIGYWDETNDTIRYASWTGTSWRIQTVDWSNLTDPHVFATGFISLALDPAGNAHLAYPDFNRSGIKVADWTGTTWNIETVESTLGFSAPSLAFDPSGGLHLAYGAAGLRHATRTGSDWTKETVDADLYAGRVASIALDADGYVHIGYANSQTSTIEYATNAPPNNPPSTPSTPVGGPTLQAGRAGNFSTSATDPDDDTIRYTFDWGDGTTSETGYLPSGVPANLSHAWVSPGAYPVRAMATDAHGATSGWSGTMSVTITAGGSPSEPNSMVTDPWMWSTLLLVGGILGAAILTLLRRRKRKGPT